MTEKPPPAKKEADKVFRTVDELAFMRECAARMNAFISTYPNEARHALSAFIPYEHELVEIHKSFRNKPSDVPPGVTFGALFAAVLQTHHGTGYYLRPLIENNQIVKLEVASQGDIEGAPHKD